VIARPYEADATSASGTFRTWRDVRLESVNRLKADMINAEKFQKWRKSSISGEQEIIVIGDGVEALCIPRVVFNHPHLVGARLATAIVVHDFVAYALVFFQDACIQMCLACTKTSGGPASGIINPYPRQSS
jgi:hypothetical protein